VRKEALARGLSPFGLFRGGGQQASAGGGSLIWEPGRWAPFVPWTSWCGPVLPPPKFPGGAHWGGHQTPNPAYQKNTWLLMSSIYAI
jgi:hypothetical protein